MSLMVLPGLPTLQPERWCQTQRSEQRLWGQRAQLRVQLWHSRCDLGHVINKNTSSLRVLINARARLSTTLIISYNSPHNQ